MLGLKKKINKLNREIRENSKKLGYINLLTTILQFMLFLEL
jgi:hypothetical protein